MNTVDFAKPLSTCYGILNNISNHRKAILFLDYDGISLDDVKQDLNKIARENAGELSDWAILKSSNNGFHAINFSILSVDKVKKITQSSKADKLFIEYSMKNSSTLRISPKFDYADKNKVVKEAPVFLEWHINTSKEKSTIRLSRAHLFFYLKYIKNFIIPRKYFQKINFSAKVVIVKYDSGSA